MAALVCVGAASGTAAQATRYQPGDRVECDPTQIGRYTPGTVVPYDRSDMDQGSGRWYRVKLDEDKIPSSTAECMANRLRPLTAGPVQGVKHGGEAADPTARQPVALAEPPREAARPTTGTVPTPPTPPNPTQAQAAGPVPRSLPGTAWKINFGTGVTGTVFLFCRSGTWEIVPARAGSMGAVGKAYRVSGTTLTTVNRDDGQAQAWAMAWEGDVLVINDGRQALRLHYNGMTQCR